MYVIGLDRFDPMVSSIFLIQSKRASEELHSGDIEKIL